MGLGEFPFQRGPVRPTACARRVLRTAPLFIISDSPSAGLQRRGGEA